MGNIYFQIRYDSGTFYTTASGHVKACETLQEAFGREIKEEIGITLDYENAELVEVVPFKMDKVKKDGSLFQDCAFANVFIYQLKDQNSKFHFDENEVDGLVRMQAKDVLKLLQEETGMITGTVIKEKKNVIITNQQNITMENFLINDGETGIGKYGKVLEAVMKKSSL